MFDGRINNTESADRSLNTVLAPDQQGRTGVEPDVGPALDECRVLEPVIGQRIPNNHDFFVDARRRVRHDRVGAEGYFSSGLPRITQTSIRQEPLPPFIH